MFKKIQQRISNIDESDISYKLLSIFILLLPWFYTPYFFEFFETGKALLLVTLNIILGSLLVLKFIKEQKVIVRLVPAFISYLFLILITVASAMLSIDPQTSIWGYFSRLNGSMVTMLALILLTLFSVNLLNPKTHVIKLINVLGTSISLFSVFVILQFSRIMEPIWMFLNETSTNIFYSSEFLPVGSITALSFVLLVALFVNLNRLQETDSKQRIKWAIKALLLFINSLALFLLVRVIPSEVAVPLLILGFIFLLVYLLTLKQELIKLKLKFGAILLILILPMIVLIPGVSSRISNSIEAGDKLDILTAAQVVNKSLTQTDFTSLIFGRGQDTFVYDFTKYKPVSFNENDNWQQRFASPGVEILNIIHDMGVLGGTIFLIFFAFQFRSLYFQYVNKRKINKKLKEDIVLVSILVLSFVSLFFVGFSLLNWILLFFLLSLSTLNLYAKNASLLKSATGEVKYLATSNTAQRNFVLLVSFSYLLIGALLVIQLVNNFKAEYYLRSSIDSITNSDVEAASTAATLAVKYGGNKAHIRRNLALVNVRVAEQALSKIGPTGQNLSNEQTELITNLYSQSVIQIQLAVLLNPHDVQNHESAAQIFGRLNSITNSERYQQETLTALKNTIEVDPYNPDQLTNLAVFLYRVDEIEQAEVTLVRAYQLRKDNINTIIALGSLYEAQQNFTKAIEFYEDVLTVENIAEDQEIAPQIEARIELIKQIRQENKSKKKK